MEQVKIKLYSKYFSIFDIILKYWIIFWIINTITQFIIKYNNINIIIQYIIYIIILIISSFFLSKKFIEIYNWMNIDININNIKNYLLAWLISTAIFFWSSILLFIPFLIFIIPTLVLSIAYLDLKDKYKYTSLISTIIYILRISNSYKNIIIKSLIIILTILFFYLGIWFILTKILSLLLSLYWIIFISSIYIYLWIALLILYISQLYFELLRLNHNIEYKIIKKDKNIYRILIIYSIISSLLIIRYFLVNFDSISLDKTLDWSKRILWLNALELLIEDHFEKNWKYPDKKNFETEIIQKSDKDFNAIWKALEWTNNKCKDWFIYEYNTNIRWTVIEYKLSTCLYLKNNSSMNDGWTDEYKLELWTKESLKKEFKNKIFLYKETNKK